MTGREGRDGGKGLTANLNVSGREFTKLLEKCSGKMFAHSSAETWVFGIETGSVRRSSIPCRSSM